MYFNINRVSHYRFVSDDFSDIASDKGRANHYR